MKTNRLLLLLLASLLIALLSWQLLCQQKAEKKQLVIGATNSEMHQVKNTYAKSIASLMPSNAVTTNGSSATRTNEAIDNSRFEKFKKILERRNAPIEFHGIVIDQNSNMVAGAKIRIAIRHLEVTHNSIDKTIYIEKESDSSGRIEINGATGDGFDVESFEKLGYRSSPKIPRTFDATSGSYENPVILKMWNLGEPQQLMHHYLSGIGIPVDETPVQFDLFNCAKVSSGGQLIVRLNRNPQVIPPRTRYDWSMELEIPNGGIVTNNDEFMYQAPESGYQETFKFDMPKEAKNWTTVINQQFYIELENGKSFGSLVVRLNTIHDTPPLVINLDIVINPSGSRSLQP